MRAYGSPSASPLASLLRAMPVHHRLHAHAEHYAAALVGLR